MVIGLWSILPGIGNAIIGSLLAWLVLARRTRETTRRLQIKSMPQFFEQRYQSSGMRLFSCIVIFLFLLPYSASVYKGLTSVCSVLLGVDEQVCMIIIAIAAALILILGGYLATLKADFVQGIIMMFGVAALIVACSFFPAGRGAFLRLEENDGVYAEPRNAAAFSAGKCFSVGYRFNDKFRNVGLAADDS